MSKQGMMERLDWLIQLRRLFNDIQEQETVQKSKLLKSLAENYLSLSLKPATDYLQSTSVLGFSFDDIWSQIENMQKVFRWDDLLNSLCNLGHSENVHQKNLESKYVEENKANEKLTLKEDFPLVKFYNLNEIAMNKNLKFLSLGGNMISSANYEFPPGLIVLNLSHNKISDFLPTRPLVNLKFLNLSHNLIENLKDITGIITIIELFISENKLNQANFLFSIKNLAILDLSNNSIENFEDIALLCTSSKLQTLSLSGNPLSQKPGYKSSVKNVIPSLIYFDPTDSTSNSSFKETGFSVPSKETKKEVLKPQLIFPVFNCHQSSVSSETPQKGKKKPVCVTSPVGKRSATPKSPNTFQSKHQRSRSNMHGSEPTTPSLNNSHIDSNPPKRSTNKSVTIKPRLKREFGDPVSAMMIGPPAVNIFLSNRSKTQNLAVPKFNK